MDKNSLEYYENQLARIPDPGDYAHTIKINSGVDANATKWLSLNEDSARVLVHWLVKQYIPIRHIPVLVEDLNAMAQ